MTTVSTSREHQTLVLCLETDRLDVARSVNVKEALRAAVDQSTDPVIVDLKNVNFIDSSGLGALVSLRKFLPPQRPVRLRNANGFVEKVLNLTKLDRVFKD